MSLRRKLGLNFGAILFGRTAGTLLSIGSVPIFISFWGLERYGGWLVLSAIPMWLNMSDLGFASVAANEMSLRMAQGDVTGANRSLHSAWAAVLLVIGLGTLVGLPAAAFLPWKAWLHLTMFSSSEVSGALILLAVTTLIGFHSTLFVGIFRAAGHAAAGSFWSGVKPLMDLAAFAVALKLRAGIVGVSAALLISQVLYLVLFWVMARRVTRALALGLRHCARGELHYSLRKGIAFCLLPLGNALLLQGSLLAVNAALGPVAVVTFGTVRTLTRSAFQAMNIINQTVWPELSHLMGRADWVRARKLHRLSVQFSIFSAAAVIAVLIAVGPWLYSRWTGRHLTIDRGLLALFCSAILTNSIWYTSSVVLMASNRHEALAWRYIVGTGLCVPACYFLARAFGLPGAAVSAVVVDLLLIPYVLKASLRLTHDSWGGFFRSSAEAAFHPRAAALKLLRADQNA